MNIGFVMFFSFLMMFKNINAPDIQENFKIEDRTAYYIKQERLEKEADKRRTEWELKNQEKQKVSTVKENVITMEDLGYEGEAKSTEGASVNKTATNEKKEEYTVQKKATNKQPTKTEAVQSSKSSANTSKQEVKHKKMVSGKSIINPYGIDGLSGNEKKIANEIVNGIRAGKNRFEYDLNTDQMKRIISAISRTYEISDIKFGFFFNTTYHLIGCNKNAYEMMAKSDFILNDIKRMGNSLKGMTEEQAIKKLFDYVVNNMAYRKGTNDLYVLTKDHIGNCAAYSEYIERVCDYIGIECMYVSGRVNVGHAWNRVKIDNTWYYLDATNNRFLSKTLWDGFKVEQEKKTNWSNITFTK